MSTPSSTTFAARQDYWLADRPVRLAYDDGKRRFAARQITGGTRPPGTGHRAPGTRHQTQIITTRADADPAPLAQAMFSRWRQENFFRYMRHHCALDALDGYRTIDDDPSRMATYNAETA